MNSQTGYIGFAAQAAKGTFTDPTFFTHYANDDIGLSAETITPSPEIGGGRDITTIYPGPAKVDGGMNWDVRPNFTGLMLYGVLGNTTPSTVDSGVYEHSVTPANTLPWMSCQKQVSDTYAIFDYTDVKINSLTMSCEAGGQVTSELDVVGLTESGTTDTSHATSTSYESTEVLMWHSGHIKIDGTSICVSNWNIEINNNLRDDNFKICTDAGRGLYSIDEKRREINITVGIDPEDWSLYQKAVYGESGATSLTKKVYSGTFWVKTTGVNAITGEYYPSITLSFDKVYFQPFKISPSGDETLSHDLNLLAAKEDGGNVIDVTVQNSTSSYTA